MKRAIGKALAYVAAVCILGVMAIGATGCVAGSVIHCAANPHYCN